MANLHSYTDDALLALLAKGDRNAFTEIYQRYHPAIYGYLLKFAKVSTVTEDLVHDVFLKIWEKRAELSIRSSFSSYLYRAARNKALDQMRRIALNQHWQDEIIHRMSLDKEEGTPEDELQWKTYNQLVDNAIARLSPQKREAFILVRQQGKSYEEAAAILGISRNTLKEHLIAAVKSIRQYVADQGDITICLFLFATILFL